MNWFERYGIPGAYFIGLMAGVLYAFYPNLFKELGNGSDYKWLLALAAITFLPIGYIISILGQAVYLNWRRWFWKCRWLRGWLGFHGAAMDSLKKDESKDESKHEAIVEARTLLLTASRKGYLSVHTHRYIRDWIARRMDVVAINQSVIWATVLAIIVARVFLGVPCRMAIEPLIVLIFIIVVMVWSIIVLRRQVIEVIAGIYQTYR